jgi:hypothetical protein
MRFKHPLIILGLLINAALTPLGAESPLTGPGGFTFTGTWNCAGNFVRSGKMHRSIYVGSTVPGSGWILLVESDTEPRGYVGHYLIGYDPNQKQVVELDANNAGYAIYSGPGWQDHSLILTSTGTSSYSGPKNRFVFESKSVDAFDVNWETDTGSGWAAADHLSCQRAADGKPTVVVSDELLVERPIAGTERQYILLNATPAG